MRAAISSIALLLCLAGCGKSAEQAPVNNAAGAEVEALPPDETMATPTDELANGAVEPVNESAPQDQ